MTLIVVAAWALAALLLLAALYRCVFFCAAQWLPLRAAGALAAPDRLRRFAVVIPAHDEELLIGELIASLRAVEYPGDHLEIWVIADNCSDQTAARARAQGVHVAERSDPLQRGKGYALHWMFERLDLAGFDAVALFDADNLVDPSFFSVMNRELARGGRCLQGYYGISNPGDSRLTRLMAVTYVMKNELFYAGKARIGLSVLLLGTGMVFARDVIARDHWKAVTIGEDLEQSFELLERGESIRFVVDARIRAQEAATLRQGYAQRQRWSSGRAVLYRRARRAIATGFRRGSPALVDAGLELLLPTYSKLMNQSLLALLLAVLLRERAPGLLPAVLLALAYQGGEIAVALRRMRAGPAFLASLAFAPVFLVWKAVIDLLAVVGFRRNLWARTARHGGGR
jgi:cellulose synthase/poly-beta-1,6-N-acetylglucosamine synthase-like glycosyltransferase